MKDFKKIINPFGSTFCKIKFVDGKLSISGVEGPLSNGNCRGSCGQINPLEPKALHEGWTFQMLHRLNEIWDEYHLNDMKAGTPEQEAFIKCWKKFHKYEYTDVCRALKDVGLYEVDLDGEPYKYGHKWLSIEVPQDVLEFLFGLPETKKTPAWV